MVPPFWKRSSIRLLYEMLWFRDFHLGYCIVPNCGKAGHLVIWNIKSWPRCTPDQQKWTRDVHVMTWIGWNWNLATKYQVFCKILSPFQGHQHGDLISSSYRHTSENCQFGQLYISCHWTKKTVKNTYRALKHLTLSAKYWENHTQSPG